ncbi:MAG: hypothetical protein M0Z99_32050 [Betaproteobacteria bacterium]|nr:hypothetical protein [Betaproteobacteria bacterium]
MWDWLSEAIDGLTGAAKEVAGGVSTALDWLTSGDSSAPAAEASAAGKPSLADVARLGTDKVGSDWATGEMAASNAKDGVWTTAGLKGMLSDLAGWAEKNPKTMVALGSAATALLKRNEANMTNQILASHYASQDATAAGMLSLAQSKQANAQTSGANLDVNGLPATTPSGLITSNVDIPGGYNARRKRNTNYGAPA